MHHLCCGVFFKLGSLHIEQYIWSLSLSYFIHEPYKWSHLDRNLRFSTVLSSTLGSGICLLSSTWDMTSHTVLLFIANFPTEDFKGALLGIISPHPQFFGFRGWHFWTSLIKLLSNIWRIMTISVQYFQSCNFRPKNFISKYIILFLLFLNTK